MSSGQFNETENPPKSYLGEIDRQPGPCFGTRPQGIIEERGEHRRGQLLAESDREAHGASDSADLLGVGAGLDQRSDLLQIYRPRKLRTRRKEPLLIEHQTKRRGGGSPYAAGSRARPTRRSATASGGPSFPRPASSRRKLRRSSRRRRSQIRSAGYPIAAPERGRERERNRSRSIESKNRQRPSRLRIWRGRWGREEI